VTTQVGAGQVKLEKVGPAPRPRSMKPITYHLFVRNPGTTDVTGIVVTDTLPEGMTPATRANVGPLTFEVGVARPRKDATH